MIGTRARVVPRSHSRKLNPSVWTTSRGPYCRLIRTSGGTSSPLIRRSRTSTAGDSRRLPDASSNRGTLRSYRSCSGDRTFLGYGVNAGGVKAFDCTHASRKSSRFGETKAPIIPGLSTLLQNIIRQCLFEVVQTAIGTPRDAVATKPATPRERAADQRLPATCRHSGG